MTKTATGHSAGPSGADEQIIAYYNGECPICSREISHYKRLADRHNAPLDFIDITTREGKAALADQGLTPDSAARRMYVLENGELKGGLDAFRSMWRRLPGFRWLAWLAGLPGLHGLLDTLYNKVAAPWLYKKHLRRQRGDS